MIPNLCIVHPVRWALVCFLLHSSIQSKRLVFVASQSDVDCFVKVVNFTLHWLPASHGRTTIPDFIYMAHFIHKVTQCVFRLMYQERQCEAFRNGVVCSDLFFFLIRTRAATFWMSYPFFPATEAFYYKNHKKSKMLDTLPCKVWLTHRCAVLLKLEPKVEIQL